MFRKIVVGYAGSDQAKDALAFGLSVAGASGAALVVAGVLPQDPLTGGRDVLFAESDAELQRQVDEAAKPGGAESLTRPSSSPARGLHAIAEELDADRCGLRTPWRNRSGSRGDNCRATAPRRLLCGGPRTKGLRRQEPGVRVVAVGYDGSPESKEALACAVSLAQSAGARLRVLVGSDPQPYGGPQPAGSPTAAYLEALREHYTRQLDEAISSIPSDLRAAGELLRGDISAALIAEAEK